MGIRYNQSCRNEKKVVLLLRIDSCLVGGNDKNQNFLTSTFHKHAVHVRTSSPTIVKLEENAPVVLLLLQ